MASEACACRRGKSNYNAESPRRGRSIKRWVELGTTPTGGVAFDTATLQRFHMDQFASLQDNQSALMAQCSAAKAAADSAAALAATLAQRQDELSGKFDSHEASLAALESARGSFVAAGGCQLVGVPLCPRHERGANRPRQHLAQSKNAECGRKPHVPHRNARHLSRHRRVMSKRNVWRHSAKGRVA